MSIGTNPTTSTEPPAITGGHCAPSSGFLWCIAFILFPYGPFIYMTWLGALKWPLTVVMLLVCGVVHLGTLSLLSQTNDQPWQPWLVLVFAGGMYCLGMLQFICGERHRLWSQTGRGYWRFFGWFFGVMLLLQLAALITMFHIISHINANS